MFLTPEEIKEREKQRALLLKVLIPVVAIAIGVVITLLANHL